MLRLSLFGLGIGLISAMLSSFDPPTGFHGVPHAGALQEAVAAVDPSVLASLQTAPDTPVIISLAREPIPPVLTGSDIAALREQTARAAEALLARAPSLRVSRRYDVVPALAATIDSATLTLLLRDQGVVAISADRRIEHHLLQANALIGSDTVHSQGVTGTGVTVAVIDSGIATQNPQLNDDLVYQHCYLASGGCPGGGTEGTSAEDGDPLGHGTGVIGAITAKPGGPAPAGIAPDAKIEAFRADSSWSDVIAAYDNIISTHPEVKLISVSLGDGNSYSSACDGVLPAMTDAITTSRALGITTFMSSGNSGAKNQISFPSCISGVIAVGAVYDASLASSTGDTCTDNLTTADQIACWSESSPSLGLLAPGADITTTGLCPGSNCNVSTVHGTSVASPIAAAVAALVLQNEPLTPADLEQRLKRTGVPIRDPANLVITCRVNALAAVQNATSPVCPDDADPDTDGDGFSYPIDNCPTVANPLQTNSDSNFTDQTPPKAFDDITYPNSDSMGDACDPDADNDGLLNVTETSGPPCASASAPTNPLLRDSDGDFVLDGAECALGSDPANAASLPVIVPGTDQDGDGLPTDYEISIGTNPAAGDTDGDKINDGLEVRGWNTNPLSTNTDGDACGDGKEIGSVNNDTQVNSTDQLAVSKSWGNAPGPPYFAPFDLNRDGHINSTDQLIQSKVYGSFCP